MGALDEVMGGTDGVENSGTMETEIANVLLASGWDHSDCSRFAKPRHDCIIRPESAVNGIHGGGWYVVSTEELNPKSAIRDEGWAPGNQEAGHGWFEAIDSVTWNFYGLDMNWLNSDMIWSAHACFGFLDD